MEMVEQKPAGLSDQIESMYKNAEIDINLTKTCFGRLMSAAFFIKMQEEIFQNKGKTELLPEVIKTITEITTFTNKFGLEGETFESYARLGLLQAYLNYYEKELVIIVETEIGEIIFKSNGVVFIRKGSLIQVYGADSSALNCIIFDQRESILRIVQYLTNISQEQIEEDLEVVKSLLLRENLQRCRHGY